MAVNPRTELTIRPWRPTTTPEGQQSGNLAPIPSNMGQTLGDDTSSPPTTPALTPDILSTNTQQEFQRLHSAVDTLSTAAPQAASAAPLNPLDGMVRYATGAWATALGVTKGLFARIAGVWHRVLTENAGQIETGAGVSTGDVNLELGKLRSGDGYSFIDFHSRPGTDFEARLIRSPGVNGDFQINQTGIGATAFIGNGGLTATFYPPSGGANVGGLYSYTLANAISFTVAGVLTGRELRFAQDVGDQVDAGVIGYRRYGADLAIVGAGAAVPRAITLYDRVSIYENLAVGVGGTGNLSVTGNLQVNGTANAGNMTINGHQVIATLDSNFDAVSCHASYNDRIIHQSGFATMAPGFTSIALGFPVGVNAMFCIQLTPIGANTPMWVSAASNTGFTATSTIAGISFYWHMMGVI